MQLGHEGRPEYTHWQQSIGHPGATPGREGLRSRRPTTSSWSARTVKEPRPFTDSGRRRAPRVPTFLPKFEVPRGTAVLGRSGAEPLPPSHAKQLHSARARLGSSGRMLGTPRGSTPRAALPFRGPPGQVGRIKSNAKLRPVGLRPGVPVAPSREPAVLRLKAAFKRGEFTGAGAKAAMATNAFAIAKLAAEEVEKKRRVVEKQQRELEALLTSLREAFHTIDKDGSGTVEPAEVLALVKAGGNKVNEAKFWDNFNQVDKDHNGLIDEQEFLTILMDDVRTPPHKQACSPPGGRRLPAVPLAAVTATV
jgi:hypothetical protein